MLADLAEMLLPVTFVLARHDRRRFKCSFGLLLSSKNTVKSHIFVWYLISYFHTFEKSAKFNT